MTGLSLKATEDIPADSTLVRMPQSLGLSPSVCKAKIVEAVCGGDTTTQDAPPPPGLFSNAKEWVVFYLFLVKTLDALPSLESHRPYVDMLPLDVIAPPHYTASELQLLEATPLHGDAIERRKRYFASFLNAMRWLREVVSANTNAKQDSPDSSSSSSVAQLLHRVSFQESHTEGSSPWSQDIQHQPLFDTWIWAQTAYSSRAFPPKMLGDDDFSGPVLLPGVDAFNHARGVPVAWVYPCAPTSDPAKAAISVATTQHGDKLFTVSLTMHYKVEQGNQAFNNYGAKSNEEFLAGYGFVLDPGLDDTLALVLGGASQSQQSQETSTQSSSMDPATQNNTLALTRPWGTTHYWRIHYQQQQESPAPSAHLSARVRKIQQQHQLQATGGLGGDAGPPPSLLVELYERLLASGDAGGVASDDSTSPSINDSWLLRPSLATPTPTPTPTPSAGVTPAVSNRNSPDATTETSLSLSPTTSTDKGRGSKHHRQQDARRLAALKLDGEVLETLEEMLCAKRKGFKASQARIDSQSHDTPTDIRESVWNAVQVYRRGQTLILDQAIKWTRGKMDELIDLIEELEDKMDDGE